jgi:glucose/mannose-6-phosphate isomerase
LSSLDADSIERVDPAGMLGDVLAQPLQLGDALWRTQSAGIRPRDQSAGMVVCGMGGSAIGGDLAKAALGDRATRPITVVRGYALESWIPPGSLVLCASYSGDTEETLACFEAAGAAGTQRVALTTGGKLAELARAEGVPVIGVPAGMQPRAAVIYMTIATLHCAAAAGVCESLASEAEGTVPLLSSLVEEWGPDAPEDSLAKSLARALDGTVPVIYGAGITGPAATRWKNQVNENVMQPAVAGVLPEANHNDLCAWERADEFGRWSAVLLDDAELHPQLRRRIELTSDIVGAHGHVVASRGSSRVERVLSLVFLGDLVSVYMAALAGVDPTPVAVLERFKGELAG